MKTAFCAAILATAAASAGARADVVQPQPIRSESVARCPGGAEWLQMRRDELKRMAARRGALARNPQLQEALVSLHEELQSNPEDAAQAAAEAADAAAAAVARGDASSSGADEKRPPSPEDAERIARLQRIVELNGVPTMDEVGGKGMTAFVFALDYIDAAPEFRIRMADELFRQRELDRWLKRNLAEMVDRILIRRGHPQRYGTSLTRDAHDRAIFTKPIEDEARLDARRVAAGLPASTLELCALRDGGGFWPPYL